MSVETIELKGCRTRFVVVVNGIRLEQLHKSEYDAVEYAEKYIVAGSVSHGDVIEISKIFVFEDVMALPDGVRRVENGSVIGPYFKRCVLRWYPEDYSWKSLHLSDGVIVQSFCEIT